MYAANISLTSLELVVNFLFIFEELSISNTITAKLSLFSKPATDIENFSRSLRKNLVSRDLTTYQHQKQRTPPSITKRCQEVCPQLYFKNRNSRLEPMNEK